MWKKFTGNFCQVLKEMHTKENWFLFLPHGVHSLHSQADRTWHGWTVGVGAGTRCLARTCGGEVVTLAGRLERGEGGDREQKELMSSGSKGIPGVCKAITGKKGVETVMTELDKLKELTIFSADEFRDEEVGMAETTSFCHSAKKHLAKFCQFPRGVLQLQGVHTPS